MIRRLFSIFFFALCASCSSLDDLATISVSETAGFDRKLEYVHATIVLNRSLSDDETLIMNNLESEASVMVQKLKRVQNSDNFEYSILFPVKISGHQTKRFKLEIQERKKDALPKELELSKDKLSVENQYYKIHFSSAEDERGGQINGVELKDFENQLLKRGHISMHWAPNFSKSGSDGYFNMEDLPVTSEHLIQRETYRVIKNRSGITDSVPEIHVEGRYEFYADLPYFLFESTMRMEKDVELDLLRNDEMTMDSLFTHVVYPKKDGSISRLKLYNEELDVLEENPISDDADWLAFYNVDKGYGFGSIRIKYDNTNSEGKDSPTHKPYTKISKASGNGRYWNRVLSDTIQTFPKGSRYYENNAYLIFGIDSKIPEKEFLHYFECFRNPLLVRVESQ